MGILLLHAPSPHYRLLGEEVGDGQFVGSRGVVVGDGHIDGDGLAAENLDALEELPLLGVDAGVNEGDRRRLSCSPLSP